MLYNHGGILSVSIDRSCIPANLQKLQGSFNNSLETNPILNAVGSGEARAFCFFRAVVQASLYKIVNKHGAVSLWQLWFVVAVTLDKECVHQEWHTTRWILFGRYTITIGKGKPLAVSAILAHTELSPARYTALFMSYRVQKCSAPAKLSPLYSSYVHNLLCAF